MMEEKEDIFKKMNKNKKLRILFFVTLMIILFVAYSLTNLQIKKLFNITSDDFSWVYQVDNLDLDNNQLIVSGFAFLLNEDSTFNNCEIILCNTRTGKGVYPKMNYISREDVNNYFMCKNDYTDSGFIATFDTNTLDLENEVYEILLRPTGMIRAYATGIYLENGKMVFADPEEFIPLDVAGTDLEKITTNGVLRVYRPDSGMYVYQYEGELYWIAESYNGFVDDDTYVEFQMSTTQIENLPKDRLANNWHWSNLGFSFTTKELTDINTGKYRVAKYALPTEYSITKIWTGKHTDEWIWQSNFRPWYEFSK